MVMSHKIELFALILTSSVSKRGVAEQMRCDWPDSPSIVPLRFCFNILHVLNHCPNFCTVYIVKFSLRNFPYRYCIYGKISTQINIPSSKTVTSNILDADTIVKLFNNNYLLNYIAITIQLLKYIDITI